MTVIDGFGKKEREQAAWQGLPEQPLSSRFTVGEQLFLPNLSSFLPVLS